MFLLIDYTLIRLEQATKILKSNHLLCFKAMTYRTAIVTKSIKVRPIDKSMMAEPFCIIHTIVVRRE